MRRILFLLLLVPGVLRAQSAGSGAPAVPKAAGSLSGRWTVDTDFYGTSLYFTMELKQEGPQLSGEFGGDKLEGSVSGSTVRFLARDDQGGTEECRCTVRDGTLSGTLVFIDGSDPEHPASHSFTARRAPDRRTGSPRRHEFVPTTFSRRFSAENKPVLTIESGDTVHTTTVDAGGSDEKGEKRVLGGNPQTGPFFIESPCRATRWPCISTGFA